MGKLKGDTNNLIHHPIAREKMEDALFTMVSDKILLVPKASGQSYFFF